MTERDLPTESEVVDCWCASSGAGSSTCEQIARTKSSRVFRLNDATDTGAPIIAKVTRPDLAAFERTTYESALSQRTARTPQLLGHGEVTGAAVLFFSEARGDAYDPRLHWPLAADYLARLHEGPPIAELPTRTTGHEHGLLERSRSVLARHLDEGDVRIDEREKIAALLDILDTLDARWSRLAELAAAPGPRFIHGDFLGRNLVIEADGGLLAFDWVAASMGPPCLDLGAAATPMSGYSIDIDAAPYLAAADCDWTPTEFDRQVAVGKVLWNLMCVHGDIQGIGASWHRRAMKNLTTYETEHRRALATLDR